MWPLSSNKHSNQAIFLYEGTTWYGRIFAWKKRSWECIESVSHLSPHHRDLPDELLAFAADHSTDRVRILLPAEIHTIQIALPSDIEPEEIHTALAYEVANEVGIDAHMVRLAAVQSSKFCMGGTDDTLLTCSFEIDQLSQYEKACKKNGMTFEGVGSIELGVLNCHARRESGARLLLLREKNGFSASPKTDILPFSVHSIPFGVEPSKETARDQERFSRAAKQFQHTQTDIHVWCSQPLSEERKQQLEQAFGSNTSIEYVDLADEITQIVTHAAYQGNVGQITCGCAMVSTPRVNSAPYRVGTWLFLMILAMTGMYIGLRWHTFHQQLSEANQRKEAWAALEQERKKLDGQVDSLKDFQMRCSKIDKLMKKPVLPKGTVTVLNALSAHMPPYTRITSLIERSNGHYEIQGTTQYQEGLIELHTALTEALRQYGLEVQPGKVEPSDDQYRREMLFSIRILPEGGRL